MQFFQERVEDLDVDSTVSAKAFGFLKQMESFDFAFYLTLMIEIFERMEILNKALQASELCVVDSLTQIETVSNGLQDSRDTKFNLIWKNSKAMVTELGIQEPQLLRQRKIPKRLDSNLSENHVFKSVEDLYRKNYYEIFDQDVSSSKSRFDTDNAKFFKTLEKFATGDLTDNNAVNKIIEFYKGDFDKETLCSDRELFLSLVKRKNAKASNLKQIVEFLKANDWCVDTLPEFSRFIRLLLTTPGSSCSTERSFSVLRRIKTYLRSTMRQERLNNVAILHVYNELVNDLDLDSLMDTFIVRNNKRSSVFALQSSVMS